jgi:hypothetical protein
MAACSPSLMARALPPSRRPRPSSSFALAASPARIAPAAAAALRAPLSRGAAIPLPPETALFHLVHGRPQPLASPAPRTPGVTLPPTHPELGDDILTEQLT